MWYVWEGFQYRGLYDRPQAKTSQWGTCAKICVQQLRKTFLWKAKIELSRRGGAYKKWKVQMLHLFEIPGRGKPIEQAHEVASEYKRLCLFPLWKSICSEDRNGKTCRRSSLQNEAAQLSCVWEKLWAIRRYEPPHKNISQWVAMKYCKKNIFENTNVCISGTQQCCGQTLQE